MKRITVFLAMSFAVVSAVGLWAQEADSVVTAINPPAASQPVPRLIMLSGTVKDLTGKPLTGPVDLNFAIYKEQADAAPLWQESQTLNLDEQGHYTALLGAMQPEGLPVDLFTSGEARWLGVSVGKLAEQPRVLLVSVPYALKANDAEMLGGKPASAYALAPPAGTSTSAGTATGGSTGPGGVTASELAAPGKPKSGPKPNVVGTGTQNYIPLWTDSAGTLGNSVMYQSGSNIGIGTTTPGYKLDVVGGSARVTNPTGTTQLTVSGSTTSGRLGQDANGFFFSSDTKGAAIRFGTNNGTGNEWMRITSAGLVGIGTTAPISALNVAGTTGLTWTGGGNNLGLATLGTPGTGGSLYINTASGSSTYQSGLGIDGTYGTPALQSVINIRALGVHSGGGYGSQLAFWTTSGTTLNQQMTLDMNGNLGIGTTTPVATLEVNGTAKFDGVATFANVGIGTTTPAQKLDVSGNLKITGAGNAIIFPDGTVQSTAGKGSGGGTITGVTAGTGLAGGGTAGNVTLSLASSSCTTGLALTGLPLTCQPFATLGGNSFTGNQAVTGNLSITGSLNSALILQPSVTDASASSSTTGDCYSGSACISDNVVAGYGAGTTMSVAGTSVTAANTLLAGVTGATIGGGGGIFQGAEDWGNLVTDDWGTVGGGLFNQAGDNAGTTSDAIAATVGGGEGNWATGNFATVAGGQSNYAADYGTVDGGYNNTASGYEATVDGGDSNTASGDLSFAAGCQATAANHGSFVWSGYNGTVCTTVTSSAAGQFLALAPGGVTFYSNIGLSAGVSLAAGGGTWSSVSDRNAKANFMPVIGESLLARLNALSMSTWNYKAQDSRFRHLGPMAQDFYGAFGLGEDDKHIDDIDGQGVALAGVQALYRLSLKKDAEIQRQQAQIRALTLQVQELEKVQRQMAKLEARLTQIEARTAKPQPRSVKRTAPARSAPRSMTLAKVQF